MGSINFVEKNIKMNFIFKLSDMVQKFHNQQ